MEKREVNNVSKINSRSSQHDWQTLWKDQRKHMSSMWLAEFTWIHCIIHCFIPIIQRIMEVSVSEDILLVMRLLDPVSIICTPVSVNPVILNNSIIFISLFTLNATHNLSAAEMVCTRSSVIHLTVNPLVFWYGFIRFASMNFVVSVYGILLSIWYCMS